ncbi:hypothetical protein [[Mycoplasma] mobile]|uniref:Expressed protein n=1 Tax=Mycoplasma mobile (strain ATCC 43663 / 163K / NCTC 11711) TaxID=267748 RepID=Q6KHJ0_MYCM1|nr:hypothetical protein [[Mycoplasma] mobile]AAT27940.1 expressed protein [Mycoplasma mobile 163K]
MSKAKNEQNFKKDKKVLESPKTNFLPKKGSEKVIGKFYLINNKNEVQEKKWFLKKAKDKNGVYFKTQKDGLDHFYSLNLNARLWISKDGKFSNTILSEEKLILEPIIKEKKLKNIDKKSKKNKNFELFYHRKNLYNALFSEKDILKISREEELGLYQEEMNLAIRVLTPILNNSMTIEKDTEFIYKDKIENEEKNNRTSKFENEIIFPMDVEENLLIPINNKEETKIETLEKTKEIKISFKEFESSNIFDPKIKDKKFFNSKEEQKLYESQMNIAIEKLTKKVEEPDEKTKEIKISFKEFESSNIFDPKIKDIKFFNSKEEQKLYESQINIAIEKLTKKVEEPISKTSVLILNTEKLHGSKDEISNFSNQENEVVFEQKEDFDARNFTTEQIKGVFVAEDIILEPDFEENIEKIKETSIIKNKSNFLWVSDPTSKISARNIQKNEINIFEDENDKISDFLKDTEYYNYEEILREDNFQNNREDDLKNYSNQENTFSNLKVLKNDDIVTTKDLESYEEYERNHFIKSTGKNEILKNEEKTKKSSKRKWYKLWLGY